MNEQSSPSLLAVAVSRALRERRPLPPGVVRVFRPDPGPVQAVECTVLPPEQRIPLSPELVLEIQRRAKDALRNASDYASKGQKNLEAHWYGRRAALSVLLQDFAPEADRP